MRFLVRLLLAAAVLVGAFLGLCFQLAGGDDSCPLTLIAYEDGSGVLRCEAAGPAARIDAESGRVSLRAVP
jgi:hypothetical protein